MYILILTIGLPLDIDCLLTGCIFYHCLFTGCIIYWLLIHRLLFYEQCLVFLFVASTSPIIDLFLPLGHLSKTLILIFGWITSCISFYALGLNSTDLSGDIMLNFFLTRTSGFGVAVGIILIANNWGRVKSLVLSHTLLGISCICLAFIPKTSINAILVVYIFANIVASISKYYHCRKNGSNLFQTTADAHPGV